MAVDRVTARYACSAHCPHTATARPDSPSRHLRLLRARHPQIARSQTPLESDHASSPVNRRLSELEVFSSHGFAGSSPFSAQGTPPAKLAWGDGRGTPSTGTPSTDSADSDPGDPPQNQARHAERRQTERHNHCGEGPGSSTSHSQRPNTAPSGIATAFLHGSMSPTSVLAKLGAISANEPCPHCARRFSSEAAARHVPICANIRSRPKPPTKQPSPSYTDSLGRRRKSQLGIGLGSAAGSRTPASPAMAPAQHDDERLSVLSMQWGQLEFLLCDCLDALADETAIAETLAKAERCLGFLRNLADYADRLGMRKGQLSKLLLPFDENTDSNKQASSASALGSQELEGRLTDEVRQELVSDAITLRGLVRVKVADCADAEQARQALRLVADFLVGLQTFAGDLGRTTTSVLREL